MKTINDYKVVNGTYFDNRTNDKVCSILANYVGCRYQRVRVFYGNTESGKDWCECYDVIGYIGRSCGSIKIPLLIPTKNSLGGGGILDHCIVKITIDKRVVYEHPKYHCPIEVRVRKLQRENLLSSKVSTILIIIVHNRYYRTPKISQNYGKV